MKNNIEFVCDRCGKPQPKNNKKSNKNWEVFDANKKCSCGGNYKLKIL